MGADSSDEGDKVLFSGYYNSHKARVENVGGGAMTKDEPNPLRNA